MLDFENASFLLCELQAEHGSAVHKLHTLRYIQDSGFSTAFKAGLGKKVTINGGVDEAPLTCLLEDFGMSFSIMSLLGSACDLLFAQKSASSSYGSVQAR